PAEYEIISPMRFEHVTAGGLLARALLLALAGSSAVRAQGRPAPNPAPIPITESAAFLRGLQSAVAHQDARAVAAMVQYPLTVLASPYSIPVPDADPFVKGFDAFFPPELRMVVALAGVSQADQPAPIYP